MLIDNYYIFAYSNNTMPHQWYLKTDKNKIEIWICTSCKSEKKIKNNKVVSYYSNNDYSNPTCKYVQNPRRTVRMAKTLFTPDEILEKLEAYKGSIYRQPTNKLIARDKALLSLIFLTAGRISEVISLEKKQFKFNREDGFIIIENMKLVKQKKTHKKAGRSPFRCEVAIPLSGTLKPFTDIFLKYYKICSSVKLFNFSRNWSWKIVECITDMYPHYFRACSENYYYKIFRNPYALRDFVGLSSVEALGTYMKTDWRDYSSKILS